MSYPVEINYDGLDQEYIDRQLEFWATHHKRQTWQEPDPAENPWINGRVAYGAIVWGLTMMLIYSLGIVGT